MGTIHRGGLHKGGVVARFCDFLRARQDVPPPMPAGFLIRIAAGDPSDTLMVAPEAEQEDLALVARLGFAQNQSFVIVYESATGEVSTRRITVRNLSLTSENIPRLISWCHEREALRSFRIDRVRAVITRDGEVIEPPASFFVETFGMSPELAACTRSKPVPLTRIRPFFTDHMMVLAHLGRVDGYFTPDEQDIVAEHCLKLARNGGAPATEAEEQSLRRFLKTLKPKKLFLNRAMKGLEQDSASRITSLLIAADAVINADGLRRHDEMSFFTLLRRDLVGMN